VNPRERYLATMLFETPDKIPFSPGGPREKTMKRWHSEGLPEGRSSFDALCEEIGLVQDHPKQPWTCPRVDFRMNPMFEEKVLEETEETLIVQDWMGNVVEISNE
jgi:hypothetical protein